MIKVKVPATSANLGPGFDTFGLALDLFLTVEAAEAIKTSCRFTGEGQDQLNQEEEENIIIKAIKRVFREAGETAPDLALTVNNQIPIGKGVGSSAAAIVSGVLIGNELLDKKFSHGQLINIAADMEGHADNIVPAMSGELTTVMEDDKTVYYQKIKTPADLKIIIAVPDFQLPTHKSREILPEKADIHDTTANLQRACLLLASFFNGDFSLLDIAMDDKIYQPLRKQFIPGFDEVLNQARAAGAKGAALSGAGPSVIAFALNREEAVGQAMQEAFNKNNVSCRIFYLNPNHTGAVIF